MVREKKKKHPDLTSKPLVEAIFEMRWVLSQPQPGFFTDPQSSLRLGRLYDKLLSIFPYHETLPTASLPEEISGYTVQHRFRAGKDEWPLVQIGPGVITYNDTNSYSWNSFSTNVVKVVGALFEITKTEPNFTLSMLLLRYIDAVEFDFENNDVFEFLHQNLKIDTKLPEPLFAGSGTANKPIKLDMQFSFNSTKPPGTVNFRILRGDKVKGSERYPAVVWETGVVSSNLQMSVDAKKVNSWLIDAHDLSTDWFFKLISGPLQGRFESNGGEE